MASEEKVMPALTGLAEIQREDAPFIFTPGVLFNIGILVMNKGTNDTIYVRVTDKDTGETQILWTDVPSGETKWFWFEWIKNESADFNCRAVAGHIGSEIPDDVLEWTIPVICEGRTTEADCKAHDCYWYNESCHTTMVCEDINNYSDCVAHGCYWWDGACHSSPAPPPSYIFRPNAMGTYAELGWSASGCPNVPMEHWKCLDEEVPDGFTTQIASDQLEKNCPTNTMGRETFRFPPHTADMTGVITKVSIVACMCKTGLYEGEAWLVLVTGGNTYEYPTTNLPASSVGWETFRKDLTVNPATGEPWTWDEIDNIEAGVKLQCKCVGTEPYLRQHCTQLYLEVFYEEVIPEICSWIDSKGGPTGLTTSDVVDIINSYLFNIPPGDSWTFIPTVMQATGVVDYYLGLDGDAKTGCDFFP